MSKNKKLKPCIRFKKFSDDWCKLKFVELYSYAAEGGTPNTSINEYYDEGTIPFVKITDTENKFIDKTETYITKLGMDNSSAWLIPENSLIFTNGATVGNVSINIVPVSTKQGILGILPSDKVSTEFLYYYLSSPSFQKEVKNRQNIGTFATIILRYLNEISVLISKDIEEQHKIEKFLGKIDKLSNLYKAKYEKIELIKKALLEKMFPEGGVIPEIRFRNFSDEWEYRKLKDEGKTFSGLSGKTKNDFGHGDARFITYMNVFKNVISDKGEIEPVEIDENQNEVKFGDVFFTTSSETPDEVGMSSLWLYSYSNIYLNSFCFGFRLNDINKYDLNFLAYKFRSKSFRKSIIFLAQGISRYNISKNKVLQIKIAVPINKKEQIKIGAFLFKLEALLKLYKERYKKLEYIKETLLVKMFV